ncbi:MAG TPA: DUF4352 domain-containing protein, partial [Candidatus Eisenbacteria bacterium]|nr:DUF4352 domain-containing protein [Candidatus Eisenbacteria bacterium]
VRGDVGAPIPVAGLLLTVQVVDLGGVPPAALRLPPSDRFVTVGVQCEGDGSGPAVVSPYDWVLTDASGAVYGPVVDGLSGSLQERQLAPTDIARGRIGFVVPRSAQGLVLNYDAEQGDASAQVPLG